MHVKGDYHAPDLGDRVEVAGLSGPGELEWVPEREVLHIRCQHVLTRLASTLGAVGFFAGFGLLVYVMIASGVDPESPPWWMGALLVLPFGGMLGLAQIGRIVRRRRAFDQVVPLHDVDDPVHHPDGTLGFKLRRPVEGIVVFTAAGPFEADELEAIANAIDAELPDEDPVSVAVLDVIDIVR